MSEKPALFPEESEHSTIATTAPPIQTPILSVHGHQRESLRAQREGEIVRGRE